MSNALLEALSMGLPVIATSIAGNEDLVENGKNGFLIPVDSTAALKKNLSHLIQDHEKRKNMGRISRDRIEKQFSWRVTANSYISHLADRISGK
jgi:glycosyltransferase involved in cell wall biosynthesis